MLAESPFSLRVGKLGILNGRSGYYVYIGSAFGPGGLQARVRRHLKAVSCLHWHIDYVRQILPIVEVWYTTDD
jgi:Uri superfamily endonuclease